MTRPRSSVTLLTNSARRPRLEGHPQTQIGLRIGRQFLSRGSVHEHAEPIIHVGRRRSHEPRGRGLERKSLVDGKTAGVLAAEGSLSPALPNNGPGSGKASVSCASLQAIHPEIVQSSVGFAADR